MIEKGFYQLIAVSTTHNQMLFRRTGFETQPHLNHDLLFEGVFHIDLPMAFYLERIEEGVSSGHSNIDVPPHCKMIAIH